LETPGAGASAALALYQKILLRTPQVPAEALAQVHRDVARAGLLKELVALSAPQFDAARHGLPVGSALLKASLDLGDTEGARRVLDLLRAQQKPEWRERLLIWEREIDRPYQGPRSSSGALGRGDLPAEAKAAATMQQADPAAALPREPQIGRAGLPSASAQGPAPGARFEKMPRDELRALFANHVQEHWEAPDELAALVTRALREGWTGDTLTAARQLVRIDPQPARSAQLLATALLQAGSFAEAEQLFTGLLRSPGADLGVLLNLLARAQIGRGDLSGAERSLWQALQADPDSEDALFSVAALHRERGGSPAETDAFRRVAEGAGSWRAPLWLAQTSLHPEHRDVPAALALYEKVLQRNPPAPPEALAQISRDLAKHGLFKELVALCAPRFEAARHGLPVAGILLGACFETQDTTAAQRLLELLYAQQRPEWRERLLFWERELDRRSQGYRPQAGGASKAEESGEEMRILSVDGPIWALGGEGGSDAPGREMLPEKSADAVRVAFFCGSLGLPPAAPSAETALAPAPATELGRFTRGLPLFLAERVHLQTTAAASTLVPRSNAGGFILAGQPWTAAALAVMPTLEESRRPDYIVFFHLVTSRESLWQAQFRIENLGEQKSEAITWEEIFEPDKLAAAVDSMLHRVLRALGESVPGISLQSAPDHRPSPPLDDLLAYLSRLEQELTAWCAPCRAIPAE
jgi:tetratricopeptide (TPR) repeat protein